MNEGAALRVLSFLNDTSERHLASLANEKRKVTVIGEEHEPDELQEKGSSSEDINTEATSLTPEQIKEFFKAIEDGSIDRIDELFDATANFDPNMTQYTESLLMAAIRAKRHKVAEYLIDQLAVNVNHSSELIEFRTQTKFPVRQRTFTCRDLAYEKGLMDLVDLIDITSDEVKPSIKRYLQRRLKARLDEIHQAYLKRVKDRSNRLIIQTLAKENKMLEEDEEEERENEGSSIANIMDELVTHPLPPPPPVARRSYKSHIEETIQSIESTNDKSIDETGKKKFRFSGYTLRYRLVETAGINKQTRPKTASLSLPTISLTTSQPVSTPYLPRPMTTATTTTHTNRRSISEINTRIPIRETRTSICRSARRIATPRVIPTVNIENKPITSINHPAERLFPKRHHRINMNYAYVPQAQNAVYNEPRRFMPVTLKATAIGLPSQTRLIRD